MALKISLGLLRQEMAAASDDTAELLDQTDHLAEEALKDLRELAHGIYPPLLADHGLPAALEAQARKAAIAVTIETPGISRYPQDVEAAVYFSILEALQNVAKYAQTPTALVTLCQDSQHLTFTVADDGKGFDPTTTPIGTGLQGITDRLTAIGGSIGIVSAPGHGTRITGQVAAARGGPSQRSDRPSELVATD